MLPCARLFHPVFSSTLQPPCILQPPPRPSAQTKQLILRGAVSSLLAVDVTTTGLSAPVANTNSGTAAAASSSRRRQLLSWLVGSAMRQRGAAAHGGGSDGPGQEHTAEGALMNVPALFAGKEEERQAAGQGAAGALLAQSVGRASEHVKPGTGADADAADDAADAMQDLGASVDPAGAAVAEDVVEAVEAEEVLVHEPGVVEALLASARALGLKPANSATAVGSEAEAALSAARRQALTALDELFWQPRVSGAALTDLVSTQQPKLVTGSSRQEEHQQQQQQQQQQELKLTEQGAMSAAAKQRAPPGADAEDAAVVGAAPEVVAAEGEGNSSSGGGVGHTVLLNGLVLGEDGVPIFSMRSAVAGSSSGSSASPVGRALIASALTQATLQRPVQQQVTITHATAEGQPQVATRAAGDATSSVGSALEALDDEADALRRMAARATAVAAGHAPGRNGGRSAVPGLTGRGMAAALQQHTAQLAALSAQLPAPAPTRLALGSGAEVIAAVAPQGGLGAGSLLAGNSEDEEGEEAEDRSFDGEETAAVEDAAPAAELAHAAIMATAPSAAAAAAITADAFAAARAAAASVPQVKRADAGNGEEAESSPSGSLGTIINAPLLQHGQTEWHPQPLEQSQRLSQRQHQRQHRHQHHMGRQLQQAAATVDVVLVLVGYTTRDDAAAASAQLTSAVHGGDLQKALGDAGWMAAAPTLVGSTEVVDSKGAASGLGGGGRSWTNMALIIGAAAGGGLAAVLVCAVLVCLFRRSRSRSGQTSGKVRGAAA